MRLALLGLSTILYFKLLIRDIYLVCVLPSDWPQYSLCCGSVSVMSYHDALLPTKT